MRIKIISITFSNDGGIRQAMKRTIPIFKLPFTRFVIDNPHMFFKLVTSNELGNNFSSFIG